MSQSYDLTKENINLQALLKKKEKMNIKVRRLYNTIAMAEDSNTLYNGLAIMPARIIGYRQTSFKML